MKIAVIGAGHIGATLGRAWAAAGHEVRFGVQTPDRYDALAGMGAVLPVPAAAEGADAIVLAVPGAAVPAVLQQLAPAASTAIIVDATNNVGAGTLNAAAAIAEAAPGAAYYRAFNTLGWENFAHPTFANGERVDLFYAGADGPARAAMERLIADVGLRPVWVGGPEHVETVDGVTRLWFALVMGRRLPRRTAFRVLSEG